MQRVSPSQINRAEKRNLDLESSVAQLRSSVNAQREEQVGRAEELAARLAAAADRTAAALREASEQRSQAEAASAGFAAARAQVDELRATVRALVLLPVADHGLAMLVGLTRAIGLPRVCGHVLWPCSCSKWRRTAMRRRHR